MDKIGFYHEGTMANAEVAAALKAKGVRPAGRNSMYPLSMEVFELVLIDNSKSAAEIGKAYEAKGVKVQAVEDFLGEDAPKAQPKKEAPFNPDAPVKKPEPKAQPKK